MVNACKYSIENEGSAREEAHQRASGGARASVDEAVTLDLELEKMGDEETFIKLDNQVSQLDLG